MSESILFKVGELARKTGVSVRALHHYDQEGLLSPTQHTDSGHRLYAAADIARLQQILSLRQLGFSLGEIKAQLENPNSSPLETIDRHIANLEAHIKVEQQIRERLTAIAILLRNKQEVSVELILQAMEAITMSEKYPFSPEQLEALKKRGEALGQAQIEQVQNEWPELIKKVRLEMERGTPPMDEQVQALAKRWQELILMFTGGDAGISQVLQQRYSQSSYASQFGLDAELFEYVAKARPKD